MADQATQLSRFGDLLLTMERLGRLVADLRFPSQHDGTATVRCSGNQLAKEVQLGLRGTRLCSSRRGRALALAEWTVFTATGVHSEAQLPFAGLRQLLRAVLTDRNEVPTSQVIDVRI